MIEIYMENLDEIIWVFIYLLEMMIDNFMWNKGGRIWVFMY